MGEPPGAEKTDSAEPDDRVFPEEVVGNRAASLRRENCFFRNEKTFKKKEKPVLPLSRCTTLDLKYAQKFVAHFRELRIQVRKQF